MVKDKFSFLIIIFENIFIKFKKTIDKWIKLCYYNSRVMTDVTKVHGPLAQLVRATGS